MKLSEIYGNNTASEGNSHNPAISFEVFPPKKGEEEFGILLDELNQLKRFNPALVSLTYGAGGNNNSSMKLVELLNRDFNVMPHFTCVCNDRAGVELHIKEIETMGINNILALRGDIPQDKSLCKTDFKHANELIEFIKAKTDLSIGCAGYPEGHIESLSIADDIQNLKKKVDAGAAAIYTQLFFDNEKFFSYIEAVRKIGINVPIIAGLMPVISTKQIERMTSMAKISIPKKLSEGLEKYKDSPSALKEFGIEFGTQQCCGLIEQGVQGLHFYTLNKSYSTAKILENIL